MEGKDRYSKFTRWWLKRRLAYNGVLLGLIAWISQNNWETLQGLGWKTSITWGFYFLGAANIIYMLLWITHKLALTVRGGLREDSTVFSTFPSFWFALVLFGVFAATVFLVLTTPLDSYLS